MEIIYFKAELEWLTNNNNKCWETTKTCFSVLPWKPYRRIPPWGNGEKKKKKNPSISKGDEQGAEESESEKKNIL